MTAPSKEVNPVWSDLQFQREKGDKPSASCSLSSGPVAGDSKISEKTRSSSSPTASDNPSASFSETRARLQEPDAAPYEASSDVTMSSVSLMLSANSSAPLPVSPGCPLSEHNSSLSEHHGDAAAPIIDWYVLEQTASPYAKVLLIAFPLSTSTSVSLSSTPLLLGLSYSIVYGRKSPLGFATRIPGFRDEISQVSHLWSKVNIVCVSSVAVLIDASKLLSSCNTKETKSMIDTSVMTLAQHCALILSKLSRYMYIKCHAPAEASNCLHLRKTLECSPFPSMVLEYTTGTTPPRYTGDHPEDDELGWDRPRFRDELLQIGSPFQNHAWSFRYRWSVRRMNRTVGFNSHCRFEMTRAREYLSLEL